MNRVYKKATIRDVAAAAEVSVTTVSHVVSGTPGYAEVTIRKVQKAILELNYVPSYVARGLRQKATQTIGVCTSDPFGGPGGNATQFSRGFWKGILAAADQEQYSVIYYPKAIRESVDSQAFLSGLIDGLILTLDRSDSRVNNITRAGLPVVVAGRHFDIPEKAAAVSIDETAIVADAMDYLWANGHRQIAHISGPVRDSFNADGTLYTSQDDIAKCRAVAYQNYLSEKNAFNESFLVEQSVWNSSDLTAPLLAWQNSQMPTAVLCANDALAKTVIESAKKLGLSIPNDLSVMGIDNEDFASDSALNLTTIDVPVDKMGIAAFQAMLRLVKGEGGEGSRLLIRAHRLIQRGTVKSI